MSSSGSPSRGASTPSSLRSPSSDHLTDSKSLHADDETDEKGKEEITEKTKEEEEETQEQEENPFETGITSLSSESFRFDDDSKSLSSAAASDAQPRPSQENNPLFGKDAACEVIDTDEIHRTVAMQFDADELDRAVELEHIRDEVEKRSKPVSGEDSSKHIGEVTITRKRDDRFLNVKINKPKKKLHSLFGAKVTCECEVYDEVRVAVWILAFLAAVTAGALFLADLSMNITTLFATGFEKHALAIGVAAPLVFLASILSFFQIRKHLQNWVHPPSQKCVIRILIMVPIYACSAWFALCFLNLALYIDFIRQCYEAFVIYQFMVLLTQYLGGSSGVVESIQYKPPIKWPAPMWCMPHAIPGAKFLRYLKYGALQYTILAPLCAIVAMITDLFGVYDDGDMKLNGGYVYVAFVVNCSQMTSLYCLVWLYVVLKNELAPFNPMYKFLVVKSVVFFTWWQGVGLAFLVKLGWIQATDGFDVGEVQVGLQDFIVCIEMFLAAAAHRYTFGYETYANGTMTLLMEQRAHRLAEMNYQKAMEEQQKRLKELGILDSVVQLPPPKLNLTKSDEDVEDGPALFDDDKPVPENVIAPVILQAMKAQQARQSSLFKLDRQLDDVSDAKKGGASGANLTNPHSSYEPLREDSSINPFERT